MSAVRVGAGTKPVTISSGTNGDVTDPRRLQFQRATRPFGARPVTVWNKTGGGRAIYIKLNAGDDIDFGGANDDGSGYFPINDGSAVEVTMGGLLSVERVSFVTINAADDLDNVEVTGWPS